MKYKFALKAGFTALALAAAGSASAGLFYLDPGINYGGNTADKVGGAASTNTSIKSQIAFQYLSTTVFTDVDNSLGFSIGDTTKTTAGLAVPGATTALNAVTNFTPQPGIFPDSNSNNGYGSGWLLSVGVTNLVGQVYAMTESTPGSGVYLPEVAYSSGLLSMYIFDAANPLGLNFMNIDITGGASGTGGTFLDGSIDYTGVAANPLNNLFHSATYSCNGSNGFFDMWNTCGANPPGDLQISFNGDFNTDIKKLSNPTVGSNGTNLTFTIANANHDGSATFDIPEPGSVALLGLGLLGLAASRRRKQAK